MNLRLIAALLLLAGACFGQAPTVLGPAYPPGGTIVSFSPGALGVNGLTEPAAGTSALSNIVSTVGVRAATLKFTCTAGNITLNVATYAEDGTTLLGTYAVLSAVTAATQTDFNFATEIDESSTIGTIGAKIRFPQRAIAFSFTNAGGAGTCTARLFLTFQ